MTKDWCEIYVDGRVSCKSLAYEIIQLINASIRYTDGFSSWDLDHVVASISVEGNDDYSWWLKRTRSDGFLFFPIRVSAEPKDQAFTSQYASLIQQIVDHIRGLRLKVTVVTEFAS